MKATIPLRAISILAGVARSHTGLLAKISAEMSDLKMSLEPFDKTRPIVKRSIGGGHVEKDLDEIVAAINAALFAFSYAHQDVKTTLEQASADLRNEFPNEREEVFSFLSLLGLNERLFTSCKASVLADEVCNLVEDSRVIVDVRPVFAGHNAAEIVASVFVRTLRISYRDASESRPKTVSFALGLDDIKELKIALEKAEGKVKLLREKIGKQSFGVILERENG